MTREEAIETLGYVVPFATQNGEKIAEAIDMAIEALSRPQGEWIPHATSVGGKKYIEYSRCSECGEMALVRMNYCPNCGARMKGGAE